MFVCVRAPGFIGHPVSHTLFYSNSLMVEFFIFIFLIMAGRGDLPF